MSVMIMAVSVALLAVPVKAAAADLQVKWFGYSQITVEGGDGVKKDESDPRIGADRVRIGYKAKLGNAFSKLQIDFNKTDATNNGLLPQIIKDAEVGYKFNNAASVKVGMFKTPVGMDFNTSGAKLDITKRGMEKVLVLERSLGIMASGRNIAGGFGYDIGYFNPTTRSGVVSLVDEEMTDDGDTTPRNTVGDDKAYAVRGMYDMGKMLHVEASYGKTEKVDGVNDYKVWDVGAAYRIQGATLKAEYIEGKLDKNKLYVWYLHAGYQFTPMYEAVVRYYQGTSKPDVGDSSSLNNTYLGLNIYLNPAKKYASRIQLNYVFAGGDTSGANAYFDYKGDKARSDIGYTDDAILAQYQVAF